MSPRRTSAPRLRWPTGPWSRSIRTPGCWRGSAASDGTSPYSRGAPCSTSRKTRSDPSSSRPGTGPLPRWGHCSTPPYPRPNFAFLWPQGQWPRGPSPPEPARRSRYSKRPTNRGPQRPLVVKAGDRTITALGTLFDVDVSPTELRVTLAEGVVAVRPVRSGAGPAQQILKPRQQLVAAAGAASPKLRIVDTDKILGWADGRVFFDNERLASAIEDMNHYSSRKITVDPVVADLRINGMFCTDNRAGFLEALEMTLPVAVRTDTQGGIHISPDAGRAVGQRGDGP